MNIDGEGSLQKHASGSGVRRKPLARSEWTHRRDAGAHPLRAPGRPPVGADLFEFIAPVIAHEVSQPLTAITGYAGACVRYLRAGDAESAARALSLLQAIGDEASRGAEIVSRMRKFVGSRQSNAGAVELAELLETAIREASPAAAHRGVSLVREGRIRANTVRADRNLIRQVLLNLIYNAIDSIRDSGRGYGTITLRARVIDRWRAEVAVSDDGVGVRAQVASTLFEPTVTTKACGSGLGLAICRSIVEAHGGRLWTEPNSSLGATFKFTLPRVARA
jgi:two-component system, LuxR family, sensor kinase FixL